MVVKADDQASAVMNNIGQAVNGVGANASAASARFVELGKVLGGALAGFAFAKAIEGAQELDAAAKQYQASVGATAEETAQAEQDAQRFFATNTEGYSDILAVMGNLRTAFQLTQDQAAGMTQEYLDFAKASGENAAGAVDQVTRALKAWNEDASQGGHVMDLLVASHQRYNLNISQTTSMLSMLAPRLQGLGIDLNGAIGLMDAFAAKGLNAAVAARGLGQAIPKLQAEGLTFNQFIEKLAGMTSETQRLNAAVDVFGTRAGPALAAAIQPGMKSLDDVVSAMGDVTGKSKQAAEAIDSSFGARATIMIHEFVGALTGISTQFGPLIQTATVFTQVFGPRLFEITTTAIGATADALVNLAAQLGVTTAAASALETAGTQAGQIAGNAAGAAADQAFTDAVVTGTEGTVVGNVIASRWEMLLDPTKNTRLEQVIAQAGERAGIGWMASFGASAATSTAAEGELRVAVDNMTKSFQELTSALTTTSSAQGVHTHVTMEAAAAERDLIGATEQANVAEGQEAAEEAIDTAAKVANTGATGLLSAAMGVLTGAMATAGAAAVGLVAALAPFLVATVAIGAAIAVLYAAWTNDWLGIQEVVGTAGDALKNFLGILGTAATGFERLLGPVARINDLVGSLPVPWHHAKEEIAGAGDAAATLAAQTDTAMALVRTQYQGGAVDAAKYAQAVKDVQTAHDQLAHEVPTTSAAINQLRQEYLEGTLTLYAYKRAVVEAAAADEAAAAQKAGDKTEQEAINNIEQWRIQAVNTGGATYAFKNNLKDLADSFTDLSNRPALNAYLQQVAKDLGVDLTAGADEGTASVSALQAAIDKLTESEAASAIQSEAKSIVSARAAAVASQEQRAQEALTQAMADRWQKLEAKAEGGGAGMNWETYQAQIDAQERAHRLLLEAQAKYVGKYDQMMQVFKQQQALDATEIAQQLPDAVVKEIEYTTNAGKQQADAYASGLRSQRRDVLTSWSTLFDDVKNLQDKHTIVDELMGQLSSVTFSKGLRSKDPLIKADTAAFLANAEDVLKQFGIEVYTAGQQAAANYVAGFSGTSQDFQTNLGNMAKLASASLTLKPVSSDQGILDQILAKLKAAGFTAKDLGGNLNQLNHDWLGQNLNASKSTSNAANTMRADMSTAFSQMKSAADAYFDELHQKHLQQIQDSKNAAYQEAQASFDKAKAALEGPITAEEKQLRDRQAAEQELSLLESLQAAQQALADIKPGDDIVAKQRAVRDAQASLDDFYAQRKIDADRAAADAQETTLQQQLTAAQKAADDKATLETNSINATDAATKKHFDDQYTALETHLKAMKKLHSDAITELDALYTQFGLSGIIHGTTFAKGLSQALLDKESDVKTAAGALAKAIKDALQVQVTIKTDTTSTGVGTKKYAAGGWAGMHGPEVAQIGESGPELVISNREVQDLHLTPGTDVYVGPPEPTGAVNPSPPEQAAPPAPRPAGSVYSFGQPVLIPNLSTDGPAKFGGPELGSKGDGRPVAAGPLPGGKGTGRPVVGGGPIPGEKGDGSRGGASTVWDDAAIAAAYPGLSWAGGFKPKGAPGTFNADGTYNMPGGATAVGNSLTGGGPSMTADQYGKAPSAQSFVVGGADPRQYAGTSLNIGTAQALSASLGGSGVSTAMPASASSAKPVYSPTIQIFLDGTEMKGYMSRVLAEELRTYGGPELTNGQF